MRRRVVLWASIFAFVTLGSNPAEAGVLILEATGSFGPTSTLGGTAFGADTPYAFRAVFDPTADRNPNPGDGAGYFPVSKFTITISGYGTFEGVPNNDFNVALLDPSYHLGIHAAGLLTSQGEPFFLDAYEAVAPPFDPHRPSPTIFLDYGKTLAVFPYVIPLAGGAGELVINDVGDVSRTAALVAVPEPTFLFPAGLGGLALLVGRKRFRLV